MAYVIGLSPAAEREWRKLEREARERVTAVLLALEGDPRPRGVDRDQFQQWLHASSSSRRPNPQRAFD